MFYLVTLLFCLTNEEYEVLISLVSVQEQVEFETFGHLLIKIC